MLKRIEKSNFARLGTALLLCSSALLTACQSDDAANFVDPEATAFYERYPIEVKKAPVKMGVASPSGTLIADQVNAITNFAYDARNNASSKVTIKWPSGSAKMRQVAMDTAQLMVQQGVPESMIHATSYPGGSASPVQLSFERKVAVTKECGDWSDDLGNSLQNTAYRNFGCSHQHNLAALAANPEDFERPRPSSPIVAGHRTAAMVIYYKSPTTVTSTASSTSAIANSTSISTSGSGN